MTFYGAVNKPIDHILAPLKARDEVSLSREREWKEKCAIISTTQDKPERPKGLCVQILPPDMTNAAFVQRLSDADGHFLYTRMDEVELLNALRIAQGMKPDPRIVLSQWLAKGAVVRDDERGLYVKC